MTCVHHYSIIQNSFTALKTPRTPPIHPSSLPPLKLLAITDLFTVSLVLPFPECHMAGIIQYVAFSDWLILINNTHLRFLHVFLWLESSLLITAE